MLENFTIVSDQKKLAAEFKPSQPEPKKPEPVRVKEPQEKYFEEIAGSEEKAKPFLEVFNELQDKKKAPAKMDELLKRIVVLVSKCEFTPEQKEKNIISRLTETPEPILKSLKDAHPNDFSKSK